MNGVILSGKVETRLHSSNEKVLIKPGGSACFSFFQLDYATQKCIFVHLHLANTLSFFSVSFPSVDSHSTAALTPHSIEY